MLDVRFWAGLILLVVCSASALAQSVTVVDCAASATTSGTETFNQRECLLSELKKTVQRVDVAEAELEQLAKELERIEEVEGSTEVIENKLEELSNSLERARADLFQLQQQIRDRGNNVDDLIARVQRLETSTLNKEDTVLTATHAAAGGACLALAPPVSGAAHITIPRRARETCANACGTHPGNYPNCRGMVAIGRILTGRSTSHTEAVNINYRYKCNDTQDAYDEVRGDDKRGQYTAYCCCYR
ncbi:hypothetical protein [uncultured Tateyamaria sp.]|uniref:hypothetical protein n=1 Tax=Tateyamaria sp. 1078 TaxID=3417464 RepID=UPI0026348CE4|nr:hypothetical protein [uncultured Tateyamaria sp.]